MPSLEALDKFHQSLSKLADELSITSENGEKIEIPPVSALDHITRFYDEIKKSEKQQYQSEDLPSGDPKSKSSGSKSADPSDESANLAQDNLDEIEALPPEAYRIGGDDNIEEILSAIGMRDGQGPKLSDDANEMLPEASPFDLEGVQELTAAIEDESATVSEFAISDEEFEDLRAAIVALPFNIKIAVEEILAEQNVDEKKIKSLIRALIRGASPVGIASRAGRILSRDLRVPPGYYRSAADNKDAKPSAWFQFRQETLPKILLTALVVSTTFLISFVGWSFVYRPIRAHLIYEQALDQLRDEQYSAANLLFTRAVRFYAVKSRFHQFAEEFINRDLYGLAAEKYEQLLVEFAYDEMGIIVYSHLEADIRGNYGNAVEILRRPEDTAYNTYDIMLRLGDVFMNWGDYDSSFYEDARRTYAFALQQFGDRDLSLIRMMYYFMRINNDDEVDYIRSWFHNDSNADIDPYIYAELAGYLIDRGELEGIETILSRSLQENNELPEAYYHLARFYREVGNLIDEEQALSISAALLQEFPRLDRRRSTMLIDINRRLGRDKYEEDDIIAAERYYNQAIDLFEQYLQAGEVNRRAFFGSIYAELGDLFYYAARDYSRAAVLYDLAEQHLYRDMGMDYRQGIIRYRSGRYEDAVLEFAAAGTGQEKNLLYSRANALYQLESYSSAAGYYSELLEILQRERSFIRELNLIDNIEHQALIEYMIKVNNNLGVSLVRIGERQRDPAQRSQGLVYLIQANEMSVNYQRDPDTLARPPTYNLAFINTRGVLYDESGIEPIIFNDVPEDLATKRF